MQTGGRSPSSGSTTGIRRLVQVNIDTVKSLWGALAARGGTCGLAGLSFVVAGYVSGYTRPFSPTQKGPAISRKSLWHRK
jgi:hypothetical protein